MKIKRKKRILYIVPHRFDRSPGQRFRCEQYIPFLMEAGYDITYSNLLSKTDDRFFYAQGSYLMKFFIFIKSLFKRFFDVFRSFRYNYIFIYRESIMIGSNIFDYLFLLSGAKIIFDFDDSIWLDDTSDGNSNLRWLKRPLKTKTSIKLATKVFAGNEYLADYARQFNANTFVVPTTIDMRYHVRKVIPSDNKVIEIGWTGSSTTIKHFESIVPVLYKLHARYGNKIRFKLISDKEFNDNTLGLSTTFWNRDSEIEQLQTIDIGIMPLPDNKWTRGKCGFKGLQYMALGIPAIMSGVGVNKDIIEDGVNGFIAHTEEEWESKLSILIEDEDLRNRLGSNGKQTIESRYSVKSLKTTYLSYFVD